ncbi:hypothetical protein F2P81_009868 [Scophthalmus maximus]|uniref:Uncharacterized protein n=1 Tax=Scophthalmus maximus TaxID=52904 RepID=A0A6A4T162_SCOMX|nr:hypothetical protein F2P81_009868 [Scophthalmus maximus]
MPCGQTLQRARRTAHGASPPPPPPPPPPPNRPRSARRTETHGRQLGVYGSRDTGEELDPLTAFLPRVGKYFNEVSILNEAKQTKIRKIYNRFRLRKCYVFEPQRRLKSDRRSSPARECSGNKKAPWLSLGKRS